MAGPVSIIHELPQGSRQGTVLTVAKSGIPASFLFRALTVRERSFMNNPG